MLQLFVNQFTTDLYHWWQPLICPRTILQIYIYVIVIPWAQVLCLIYIHKPEGHRPEGEYVYRQSTSARGITNMFNFNMLAKSLVAIPFSYIGNQISCDCGIQF